MLHYFIFLMGRRKIKNQRIQVTAAIDDDAVIIDLDTNGNFIDSKEEIANKIKRISPKILEKLKNSNQNRLIKEENDEIVTIEESEILNNNDTNDLFFVMEDESTPNQLDCDISFWDNYLNCNYL